MFSAGRSVVFGVPCLRNCSGAHIVFGGASLGYALLLFRNLHRALSRAYLLETVWGRNPDLPTRTLNTWNRRWRLGERRDTPSRRGSRRLPEIHRIGLPPPAPYGDADAP